MWIVIVNLKRIERNGVCCIKLAEDGDKRRALGNTVINLLQYNPTYPD